MKILVLGMYCMAQGEISYESRIIHSLAEVQPDSQVVYMTDRPLDYSREYTKPPPNLKNILFAKGDQALAHTPRTFTGEDARVIMENGPYDAVFGTSITACEMLSWLKGFLQIPVVLQVLDVPVWRLLPHGPSQIYKESIIGLPLLPQDMFDNYKAEWDFWFDSMKYIDAIVTIENVTQAHLRMFLGNTTPPMYTVYHGSLDKPSFQAVMGENFHPRKTNTLICMMRWAFHKGIPNAIHVAHLVQQKMGEAAPEFVLGSGGGEGDWYSQIIMDYASRILTKWRTTGWISNKEKIQLISEAGAMLCLNWAEATTPGVIAGEALFLGTPVFCWDLPQNREVYGDHCFYFQKGDYEGMANAIVDLLEGRLEWGEKEKTAAREFVSRYRSIEAHARGIADVLRKVAQ